MRRRRCGFTVALVGVLLASNAAHAQGVPPEIEALLRVGIAHRVAGRDEEALRSFEAAYAARPAPVTAGQLALALQALGRWVDADRYMREALAHADDGWVRRHRRELAEADAIVQRNVGSLEIRGGPDGAAVLVDGVARGTLPLPAPLRLRAGVQMLEIRAEGYLPFVRQVTLLGGERTLEPVTMVLRAREEASAPATPPPVEIVRAPTITPVARPRPTVITGWVLGGSGVALGLLGAVSLGLREASAARFNAGCPALAMVSASAQSSACREELATGDWSTPTAIAGLSVGAVLLGVGAAMLLMPAREHAARGWWCAPHASGAACVARF